MIDWISDKEYWQPALDQSGNYRNDAWVINATDVIPLTDYPPGTKLFLRAEPLHPGAQPTLLDAHGHRITAFLTNSPRWHGPFLDDRHRARGRCENRIKTLKNTGLGKLQFFDFAANQAWANIAALPDGHRAKAWDIKRWRYRIFATAGKIITRARPPPAPSPGISTGVRPPETTPGEHRPPHQRSRSFYRLSRALIPSRRAAPSPEVEPAPNQANQQATPDCPKTENNPRIKSGPKPAIIS